MPPVSFTCEELDVKVRKALAGHDAGLSGSTIDMIVGQAFAQADQDSVLEGASSVVQGLDMLGRHCKTLENRIEDINTNATGIWYSDKNGGFPNITKDTQLSDFTAEMVNKLGENINNELFFLCDGNYMSVTKKHIQEVGNLLECQIEFFSDNGKKVNFAFDYYKGTGTSQATDITYTQSFPNVTKDEAGFMSAADKVSLDALKARQNATQSEAGWMSAEDKVSLDALKGRQNATQSEAGWMSADDKKTLDALSTAKLFKVEQTRPSVGEANTIYLVPVDGESDELNTFEEYIYVDNSWELLGKFHVDNDTITKVAKGNDVSGSYVTATTKVEPAGDSTYNVSVELNDVILDDVVKTIEPQVDEDGAPMLAMTKLDGSVETIDLSALIMPTEDVTALCKEIFGE